MTEKVNIGRVHDIEFARELADLEHPYRELASRALLLGSHMKAIHDDTLTQANTQINAAIRERLDAESSELGETYRDIFISRSDIQDYLVETKKATYPLHLLKNPYSPVSDPGKYLDWQPHPAYTSITREQQRATRLWNALIQQAADELRPDYGKDQPRLNLVHSEIDQRGQPTGGLRFDSLMSLAERYKEEKRKNPDIKASDLFGSYVGEASIRLIIDYVDYKTSQIEHQSSVQ